MIVEIKKDISLTGEHVRFQKIHFAWLMMFCSILNWRLRDVMAGQSFGDIFDIFRISITITALFIAIIVIFVNLKRVKYSFSLPILFLFMYGLAAMLSSILVDGSASFYAFWKSIELIVMLLVILATLSSSNPYICIIKSYELLILALKVLIIVFIVQAIIWPNEAFFPSRGIIPVMMQGLKPIVQQNGLAFYSAVVILSCFSSLHVKSCLFNKILNLLMIFASSATLVLSQSRTSIVGIFVAILIFILLIKKKSIFFVCASLLFGLIIVELSSFILEFLRRGQDENLIYSLSGRTDAWSMGWELFKESPLVGHGFVAGSRAKILGGGMSTMHGAVFDVLVGMGLVGLVTWGGAIIFTSFYSLRLRKLFYAELTANFRVRHAEMLSLFALILVRTTTNSGLAMHDHVFMLFLCFLGYAQSAIYADKNKSPKNESF